MKTRNKIILAVSGVLLVALIVFVVQLVGKKDTYTHETIYGEGGLCFSPEGVCITVSGLRFFDPVTSELSYLCRIPNCTHETSNEECEAFKISYANGAFIYEGNLYYFERKPLVSEIWVRELAGSGERKLAEVPFTPKDEYFIIVDGKLYCTVTEALDDYGIERSGLFLVEIDINTGAYRRLTEEESYGNYKIKELEIFNGELYYNCTVYPEGYDEMYQEHLKGKISLSEIIATQTEVLHKVNLDTLEKTNCYNDEERYILCGTGGGYLIVWDSLTGEILAVDKKEKAKVIGTAVSSGVIYPVMGDYVGYIEDEKVVFVSLSTGKETEREWKNCGAVISYNSTLDAIFTLEKLNNYNIFSVDDFISGDFELSEK